MEIRSMGLFNSKERAFAEAVSNLAFCNPFLTERIEYERQALGSDFHESRAVWNLSPERVAHQPNVDEIMQRVEKLLLSISDSDKGGGKPTELELRLYEDLVLFYLYYQFLDQFLETGRVLLEQNVTGQRIEFYEDFAREAGRFLHLKAYDPLPAARELPHIFACFSQVRRAFFHIFNNIIGVSEPAVRLRAMVWQSIFTHDMRRYRRTVFNRMGDITTLITGPSGTGKELVARAIGMSRYIPFDPKTLTFPEEVSGSFLPLNLSALSPTLIESELFGHRRGSFTGAVSDRKGWIEVCPALGTVFLDEIGDIELSIQVKLLRVLENRRFQRLGESKDRTFKGKIITATNRNLAEAMEEGRFREDLYYRLCSDIIVTPSLYEQIQSEKDELEKLVLFIARREVDDEAPELAAEVLAWIGSELGPDYPWPGNIRELSQCVRNILIRKVYHPAPRQAGSAREELAQAVTRGELSIEELMRGYCSLVYSQTGSYEKAARRLGLDRRTVKAKIDAQWMKRL
jgi:transcriptional regulator with AAA-type ATPase domain